VDIPFKLVVNHTTSKGN